MAAGFVGADGAAAHDSDERGGGYRAEYLVVPVLWRSMGPESDCAGIILLFDPDFSGVVSADDCRNSKFFS